MLHSHRVPTFLLHTTVLCPDKKLSWFDDEQAIVVESLVQQQWSDAYENFSHAEEPSRPDSPPTEVCHFSPTVYLVELTQNTGPFKVALGPAGLATTSRN